MGFLTRTQILKADDRKFIDVEVPEWGGAVRVQTLSAAQREAWESYCTEEQKEQINLPDDPQYMYTLRSALLSLALTNDKNELIFSADDIDALSEKNSVIVARLFAVAKKLNALTKEDFEAILANFTQSQG